MRGIEESRRAYEEKGRAMIAELFPEYESVIAVGLAGHGSECFGYDDDVSRDHDFEQGFCLWIDDRTDGEIGVKLGRAYRALGFAKPDQKSAAAGKKTGIHTISEFFLPYTGSAGAPESWQQWLALPSESLAEAVNGEVWRDDLGIFTAEREKIRRGMPEDVRIKKLAARTISMAQSGQYNYSRCLKHGEYGAAMLALGEFVNNAAGAIFLLNREHMPYYKWRFRRMGELPVLGGMRDALEFLLAGDNDEAGREVKAGVIEDVCAAVVKELKTQHLTCGSWDYLEPHAFDMTEHIQNPEIRAMHIMEG